MSCAILLVQLHSRRCCIPKDLLSLRSPKYKFNARKRHSGPVGLLVGKLLLFSRLDSSRISDLHIARARGWLYTEGGGASLNCPLAANGLPDMACGWLWLAVASCGFLQT